MSTHALPSQSFKPASLQWSDSFIGTLIVLARAVGSAFSRSRTVKAVPSLEQEANDLRVYAQQFAKSDPGFADDLFAAADRHEQAAMASTAR